MSWEAFGGVCKISKIKFPEVFKVSNRHHVSPNYNYNIIII